MVNQHDSCEAMLASMQRTGKLISLPAGFPANGFDENASTMEYWMELMAMSLQSFSRTPGSVHRWKSGRRTMNLIYGRKPISQLSESFSN